MFSNFFLHKIFPLEKWSLGPSGSLPVKTCPVETLQEAFRDCILYTRLRELDVETEEKPTFFNLETEKLDFFDLRFPFRLRFQPRFPIRSRESIS